MSISPRLLPTIRRGPSVDRYLASEGAIAQAADRDTILLRSSVLRMSPAEQAVLLLHELAHAQQLARPGNDPIRALEDEAWEAAHAWAGGRPHRVRGRARRPLNAVAIVQGGETGHPSAPSWYASSPVEPIGNQSTVKVGSVKVLEQMTVESVLDTIIQEGQKEVVLVCHGWSEGLAIPLVEKSSLGAATPNIARLSADRSFKREGVNTPVVADKDVANQLSEERVRSLRAKMNQVRGLSLEHVALRSCDMGLSPDTAMDALRLFFGARSVSAPRLLDSYGQFKPLVGGNVQAWADAKRKAHGYRAWVDRGVAVAVKRSATSAIAYQIESRAPDNHTFAAWVKAHVADRPGQENAVVFHGMADFGVADPVAPVVHFVRDEAFLANLVFYAG